MLTLRSVNLDRTWKAETIKLWTRSNRPPRLDQPKPVRRLRKAGAEPALPPKRLATSTVGRGNPGFVNTGWLINQDSPEPLSPYCFESEASQWKKPNISAVLGVRSKPIDPYKRGLQLFVLLIWPPVRHQLQSHCATKRYCFKHCIRKLKMTSAPYSSCVWNVFRYSWTSVHDPFIRCSECKVPQQEQERFRGDTIQPFLKVPSPKIQKTLKCQLQRERGVSLLAAFWRWGHWWFKRTKIIGSIADQLDPTWYAKYLSKRSPSSMVLLEEPQGFPCVPSSQILRGPTFGVLPAVFAALRQPVKPPPNALHCHVSVVAKNTTLFGMGYTSRHISSTGTRQAANKFLELLNLHRQSIRSTFVLDTIIAGTQSFCHFASAGDTPLASPGRSELMISSVLNHNQPKAIAVCQLVSSYACNRHATSRCLLLSATLHHTLGLWTATRKPVLSTFTTYLCQADRNVSPMQCHIFTTRCPANTSVPASPTARAFADAQRCSVKTESNVCQKFSCISDRMKSHAIHCFPISPCLATHLWVHQVRPWSRVPICFGSTKMTEKKHSTCMQPLPHFTLPPWLFGDASPHALPCHSLWL